MASPIPLADARGSEQRSAIPLAIARGSEMRSAIPPALARGSEKRLLSRDREGAVSRIWLFRLILLLLVLHWEAAAQKKAEPRVDPRAISIHPFVGQRGVTFTATVRGAGLKTAYAVFLENAPFRIAIESAEPETPTEGKKTPMDLVHLRVEVAPDAKPGRYPIRLITKHGVSNALPLHVTEQQVLAEPEGSHESPESAVPVKSLPALFAGRLTRRGESDYYAFQAKAGESYTFEVISGFPQIAATGSAATVPNFDPAISIYEPSGSWFDSNRLRRVASNDEPDYVGGRSTDAYIVHRFANAGAYLLRVEAFAGQGGPDYSYQLKVLPGEAPRELAPAGSEWGERSFTRRLTSDRLNQLATRGGKPQDQKFFETYRAIPESPVVKLPAAVEGAMENPGEAHRFKFELDAPRDVAIEVETPVKSPPFFNPIVRLLNSGGEEVATNLFAGKGACSGALTKSLQAKTVVPLRDTGTYTVEIRDATSDLAGSGFQYRVLVRQQAPHVGQIAINADHVNLLPGEAKTIRVVFDREEGYTGALAVFAEGLPPGVHAAVGADFEPDKDPPLSTGKRERYTPRSERTVVVLTATQDAPPTPDPHTARLVVRPLVDGKLGDVLTAKPVLIMVTPKI